MIHPIAQMPRPVICQVLHSLMIGGAEILAADLARKLQKRFQFVFVCLDNLGPLGEQLRDEGFVVEVLERKPGIDWRCGLRLGRFLKAQNVRLIHAHQYTPFFQSLLGRCRTRRVPIVFTEHGRQFPDYRRSKRVLCNRLLIRAYDRVVAVSDSVRSALVEYEGIASRRVEVIRNGVRLEDYIDAGSNEALRREVRRELNLAENDFVILQVARLNYLKDHRTAIRAIEQVRRCGVPVRLLMAGDGEERQNIENLIRELQLEPYVELLGTRRDIARLLAASDAFLLSSISEGIPLTIIEAMAASRPVVSTDVGGINEVVVPEKTGLLAESRDHKTLAHHLAQLSTDSELSIRLGHAGQQRAQDEFDQQQMIEAYATLYRGTLRRPRSGPPMVRNELHLPSISEPNA